MAFWRSVGSATAGAADRASAALARSAEPCSDGSPDRRDRSAGTPCSCCAARLAPTRPRRRARTLSDLTTTCRTWPARSGPGRCPPDRRPDRRVAVLRPLLARSWVTRCLRPGPGAGARRLARLLCDDSIGAVAKEDWVGRWRAARAVAFGLAARDACLWSRSRARLWGDTREALGSSVVRMARVLGPRFGTEINPRVEF